MSITDEWIYENVCILLDHKKEWSTDTYYHTDELRNDYAKWNKPGYTLQKMFSIDKSIGTQSRLEVA
jgi:hypothetical protein